MRISSMDSPGSSLFQRVGNTSAPVPASSAASTRTSAGGTSDIVTLSQEAQDIASLNAKGVTVAQVPLSDPSAGGQPHFVPLKTTIGSVSQGDFETLASRFGLSGSAADQIFRQIDTDGDGSVSNSEFIKALGATGDGTSPLSSAILRMMDTDRNGTVSGAEFLNLESAVVEAEKPTSKS